MSILFSLLLAAQGAPVPAATAPDVEKCGVIYEAAQDTYQTLQMPNLHVMGTGDAKFVLPPDAPKKVSAVICGRASIIPQLNDVKVLSAGYPLFLVAHGGKRSAVLEGNKGQLQLEMREGEFTDSEAAQAQEFLDQAKTLFKSKP